MTVKKRLFWSNILMILVPVFTMALIGLACVGFIWFALIHGMGLGIHDAEEFEAACAVITEGVEKGLERNAGFSSIDAILEENRMSLSVFSEGKIIYSGGEAAGDETALYAAAASLGGDVSISKNGRMLYMHAVSAGGRDYTVFLSGAYRSARSYAELKTAVVLAAALILLAIFASILLTNRFLTKFVWRRIEEPLDILADGVHQLRDGNLDYRIAYDKEDEFSAVCADFNEMAGRLKMLVQKLQMQERSRRELIAGISHDIRSPLTSIRAYVEGLLDGVAATPEAERRYLETIRDKAGDLDRIVSQLFLFSKMELGEHTGERVLLRLDNAICEIVRPLAEEYRAKGLRIELALEPFSLRADPVQLQRITANILENSLKYKTKPQGTVRISLHREENGACLSFADDGPGVPEEALPHLFEVFYRGDAARSNPHQGSGLGLAIVAAAAKQLGGRAKALPSALGGLEIRIELKDEGE